MKSLYNKYLYIGFVLLGLYELLVKKSVLEAVARLGIALIFNPFDQNQPWKERPQWQKAILIIHLALMGGLFVYEVGYKDFLKGMEDGWNCK